MPLDFEKIAIICSFCSCSSQVLKGGGGINVSKVSQTSLVFRLKIAQEGFSSTVSIYQDISLDWSRVGVVRVVDVTSMAPCPGHCRFVIR